MAISLPPTHRGFSPQKPFPPLANQEPNKSDCGTSDCNLLTTFSGLPLRGLSLSFVLSPETLKLSFSGIPSFYAREVFFNISKMKVINIIIFNLVSAVLYAAGAYSAETLTDILALLAGMVQSLIYIVNLNNYPSVYFNLCKDYNSLIVPMQFD